MNAEERRLSNWLHAHAPEPPHSVTVESIERWTGRAQPSSRRHGVPLVVAAGVVAIAAVGAVASLPERQVGTPAASTTSKAAPTPSVGRSKELAPIEIGSWRATRVGGEAATAVPRLGRGDSLYALRGRAIVRIGAPNGRVLAHHALSNAGALTEIALAKAVWVSPLVRANGRATLHGYDADTLAPRAAIPLTFGLSSGDLPSVPLAASADGRRVYLGLGRTIDVVDTTAARVVDHFTVPGESILDLAVSPDGARIYVAVKVGDAGSRVYVLDPQSGSGQTSRMLDRVAIVNNIGLVASTGGVWVHAGGGNADDITFLKSPDLTSVAASNAVPQGRPITVATTGNVVWIGGPNVAACADASSGRVLAHTDLPARHGSTAVLTDIRSAGGQLFASYSSGDAPELVRLSPSDACTG